MAVTSVRQRWEHEGFFIADQFTEQSWGTACDSADLTWQQWRESARNVPQAIRPRTVMRDYGHGKSYPYSAHTQAGKPTATIQTTFPATIQVLTDLLILLYQSNISGEYAVPFTNSVTGSYATIACRIGADGDDVCYVGEGMIPSQLDITIPQNVPGESGGVVELGVPWIGRNVDSTIDDLEDWPVHATPAIDTGAYILTRDCAFKIDPTGGGDGLSAASFISASLSLSAGAYLLPDAAANLSGFGFGGATVTGSVTVLDEEAAGGSASLLLKTELDAGATVTPHTLQFLWASVADLQFDATILSVSDPVDVGGALAWTYNFELGGDADYSFKMKAGATGLTTDGIFT